MIRAEETMTNHEQLRNLPLENGIEADIESQLVKEKPARLSERLYGKIKSEILSCKLKPGASISDSALARRYKVSRTPVREALARVIQDDLILTKTGIGFQIAPITVKDVHDVFALRVLLEGEAAELAASKVTQDILDKLNDLLQKIDTIDLSTVDDKGRLSYVKVNNDFHLTIAKASGNRKLFKIIKNLMDEASRYIFIESSVVGRIGIEESQNLVKAFEAREREKAREIVENHILSSYRRTMDALMAGDNLQLHFAN